LVRLQELDLEARELERIQSEMPGRLAALEKEFNERLEEIGGARLRHEQLGRQRDQLSSQLEETSDRLTRAQQKLMSVTNQREYSAALNEIDSMKHHVNDLEQQILELEEQIEELSGPAAEADERIAEERGKLEEAKHHIEEEARELATRLQHMSEDRARLVQELPPSYVGRFEKLARLRDGRAMARIAGGACSACHVRLRPQVISLVRRGEDLISCESCGRILYLDEGADESLSNPSPAATQP
jgi:hypothetical protein